jgi:ubiquinone/menaquinone biosynthesis C-methylase UbiE
MTDIFKKAQTAYDQIVTEFAECNHDMIPDSVAAYIQKLFQYIGQDAHLLEVGCGTRRDMAVFESGGISVTGIDLSSGMLRYARQHVQGELLSMNMCNIGFCSAHFDGAWCCASLLHLQKNKASYALGEIHRVLKPDRMLILCVQKGNGEGWEYGYIQGQKRFFARYQACELKDVTSSNGLHVCEVDLSQGGHRD